MRKIFRYPIIIVTAAALGIGVGVVSKKVFGPTEIDYGDFDFGALKVNAAEIVKKIDSYTGSADIIDNFTVGEVLNYSMEKFRTCENCCSFTFGAAETIVNQDIRGCLIKNGDKYFEESVSKSSMVSLANRMYQNGKDADVSLYHGKKGSVGISENSSSAEYSETNKENFTSNGYRETYGKTLDEMFIYLISDQTITNSNIVDLDNGGYAITVELDPDLSTDGYKNQMYNISGLDERPVFSSVKLIFTLDKDLVLKKLTIDENYTAKMMVNAKTHGNVNIYYFANEFVKIPELNESVTYMKGE